MSIRLQITSIALLVVFITNTFVLSLVYIAARQYSRYEMKEKLRTDLKDSELKTVELSQTEFKEIAWLEENEIRINGELYDVHSVSFSTSKVILKIISDEREDQILKKMDEQEAQKQPLKKGTQFAFLFLPLFSSEKNTLRYDHISTSDPINIAYIDNYSSHTRELSTPPPKTA